MRCILIYIFLSSQLLWAKGLDFKNIQYSQVTVSPDILGLLPLGDEVYETPYFDKFLIQAKFNDGAKEGEFAFGNLRSDTAGASRFYFPPEVKSAYWHNLSTIGEKILMIEGRKYKLATFEPKTKKFQFYGEMIIDLFRPARDSRGEPTSIEVAGARGRFKSALVKLGGDGIPIAGVARLPEAWRWSKAPHQYLLATRIPGFPLMYMECSEGDGVICQWKRQCFLEGLSAKQQANISGLAIHPQKKQLILTHRKDKSILIFSWQGCSHIPKKASLTLPKELHPPRGINIDEQGRLWLSTSGPDNFRNSSVYVWPADSW